MTIEELAESIYEVIKDYRNHDNIFITQSSIIEWAAQFDENSLLVLTELNSIIKETYVSREKAKEFIYGHILEYLKLYNYSNITTFLIDTEFLEVQQTHKSQPAILNLLEEVLDEKFKESYLKFKEYPKINFVYFDDILASGSTIGKDVIAFLNKIDSSGKKFDKKIQDNEIKFSISIFCLHTWGFEFQKYRIQKEFNDKVLRKINWFWNYEIQNHAKFNNQKLNIAKPVKGNNLKINSYLENLSATKYEDYAFRKSNTPVSEEFFTSAENRIKFENILTEKGIDIINMIQGEVKTNIRPLGLINPQYKIFGLGTHFFTWRNIPNNSPLVYWWEVQGHNWIPLFCVFNRGN